MEHVQLLTADGVVLDGDLSVAESEPRGAVALCHPHPQYGGNRFNPVVDAIFRSAPAAGLHALRFDFRAAFGGGVDERLDLVAALDELDARFPATVQFVVGYSFGAAVALSVDDPRVAATVAIAPPLAVIDAPPPAARTLVLVPEHDQFSPPSATEPIVGRWPDAVLRTVPMADHFLAGRLQHVVDETLAFLTRSSGER